MPVTNLRRGVVLILACELFLVISGMIIKQLNGIASTGQIVFFRNLFGLALLMPWLWHNGIAAIKTQCMHLHIMRAVTGVIAMTGLFYSWGHLPLAQAALLKQMMPLFIPIVAFVWMREYLPWQAQVAVVMGFIGVILILNPDEGILNIGVLAGLGGAVFGAVAKTTIRRLRYSEPPQRVVFYFAAFASVLSAIPALLDWYPLSWLAIGWLVLLAAAATMAQLLMSAAYGHAPAGQIGAFTYSSVAFAALLGWALWDEVLTLYSLLGIVIITAAGLLVMTSNNASRKSSDSTEGKVSKQSA